MSPRHWWRYIPVLLVLCVLARGASAQSPVAGRGTSSADYYRDVLTAMDLDFRLSIARDHYWVRKDMNDSTFRAIERPLSTELSRLIAKWHAAGRGSDFERDYRGGHASSEAAIRALAALNAPKATPARQTSSAKPDGRSETGYLVLGTVFWLALGLYLISRKKKVEPAPRPPVSTVHGTAHYAPVQPDLADETCLAKGVFFGKSSAPEWRSAPLEMPGAPVCSTPEHHTLIVARTRTGKGTRVIVPTLLRYRGSALVIDPKGENAAITARVRKLHLNQSIHILNPWNELAGTYEGFGFTNATYNPLDILDRTDPNVVALAQTLAGAICPAPPSAKDRFWQGSAANVLTAVFLWLTDQAGETKTLGRVRQIISLTRKEFTAKYLSAMAASEAFDGAISEMAAPFIDLADETYSGIMSNLSESTKFLSDPQIKAATAKSSFSMEELATGKATVYVVIPTERMDTQQTWLRLIIAAGMHIFKHPRAAREHRHRCLFLIDEFAALGRLDELPRDIATMSGFGVDFVLIVQGLDQLKDHYGEARGAILSNCAYKWFCNVNDLDSAKYLSDILGKATVATESTSASSSSSTGGQHGSYSSSQTTSRSETARSLLNPDEVLNLGRNVAILLQPQGHPHYLRPVDYWNLPRAFGYLQVGHPSLYWNPPLEYDRNPYIESAPPPPASAPPPPPLPPPPLAAGDHPWWEPRGAPSAKTPGRRRK